MKKNILPENNKLLELNKIFKKYTNYKYINSVNSVKLRNSKITLGSGRLT